MNKNDLSIERIDDSNYKDFCRLIQWRITGMEQVDISRFQTTETKEFFEYFKILKSDWFYVFAVVTDEKMIGWISAALIPKPDSRLGTLFVDELWVAENYRNRGAAKLLMREVFRVAKELKLWRVRLYTNIDNTVGREFYKSMGFSENGTAVFCERDAATL